MRVALGALFISQRLCLGDEEAVGQIRDNVDRPYRLAFRAFPSKLPRSSMIVHFRERIFGWDLIRINELIAMLGMATMLEDVVSLVVEDSVVIQVPMRATSAHSLTLWSLQTGRRARP